MKEKSESIQAIELARAVFESVHGNIGLLKFGVEKLAPSGGACKPGSEWEIVCSFYETLGSRKPSRFGVRVDLDENIVRIRKLDIDAPEVKYKVMKVE